MSALKEDQISGWRYVARAKYSDDDWVNKVVDTYLKSIKSKDGMAIISIDDLKDLLCSAWIDGKED